MFYQFFSYIKFLLKSQNQHGLHSPFVYDFVTKGLYKKKVINVDFSQNYELKNLSKKQHEILSKIVIYFKINTVFTNSNKFKNTNTKEYNILYINDLHLLKNINFNILTSNHIILIDGIYQNKQSYQEWQNIAKNKHITASIDLFYFGLIFFRKEQAKEHFIIRS